MLTPDNQEGGLIVRAVGGEAHRPSRHEKEVKSGDG
jgi:hypothetical protein